MANRLQAPLTPSGTPVVNALAKQRACLTNIFRACVGLEPENDMTLVSTFQLIACETHCDYVLTCLQEHKLF